MDLVQLLLCYIAANYYAVSNMQQNDSWKRYFIIFRGCQNNNNAALPTIPATHTALLKSAHSNTEQSGLAFHANEKIKREDEAYEE